MIVIDTPFHVTFSATFEKPSYACTGKCKKSFWLHDFENTPTMGLCPTCKSGLITATENVHFKVLKHENRNFKKEDFYEFADIEKHELEKINNHLKSGIIIAHMSNVKRKFIAKAMKEWC